MPKTKLPFILIASIKCCLALKLTLDQMIASINKTKVYGINMVLKCILRPYYIHINRTVYCVLWDDRIIGSIFVENVAG